MTRIIRVQNLSKQYRIGGGLSSYTTLRVDSSVCKIPGKLLKSGKFFLTVGARRQGIWIESHENLLMFEVSAIGNPLHPPAARRNHAGA